MITLLWKFQKVWISETCLKSVSNLSIIFIVCSHFYYGKKENIRFFKPITRIKLLYKDSYAKSFVLNQA